MKRILFFLLSIVVTGFFLFPYIGYVYLVIMSLAGIGAFVPSYVDLSILVLSYGWKIYLAAAALTFFVMTTFVFLQCCVGMNTFVGHLKHAGHRHLEVLEVAVFWPIMWAKVHRGMSSWGMPWFAIMIDVIHYWTVQSWRGTPVEVWWIFKSKE